MNASDTHRTTITEFIDREYVDRYTDSPDDSLLWLDLFALADRAGGEPLAATLQVIRNTGAILIPSEKYGYKIQPVFGPRGFADQAEYDVQRKHLHKYGDVLLGLLKRLGE